MKNNNIPRGKPMLRCFIAYFDLLGFKNFILLNESDDIQVGMGHVLRDLEGAIALGKYHQPSNGLVHADMSDSKINCLNISDTIVFWTNDCSKESFEEILKVSDYFNRMEVVFNFPLRGVLVCDEIRVLKGEQKNAEGTYTVSLLYGKGIVNAHLKAENLNWAGSVIDQTAIEEASKHTDTISLIERYAKKYLVPYKKPPVKHAEEYAFSLVDDPITDETFEKRKEIIERNFSMYNKSTESPRVQEILANTISFLETFRM